MRRASVLTALALLVAACGDTAVVPDTTGPATAVETSAPTTTTSPTAVVTTTAAPLVTAAPGGDLPDCLSIWPEDVVQGIAGERFTFFQANADRTACIYEAIPNSIALAARSGNLSDFELGRTASEGAGAVTDVAVCDAAYFIELPGAGLIMEALDAANGRVYTATIAGTDVGGGADWAGQLLGGACAAAG